MGHSKKKQRVPGEACLNCAKPLTGEYCVHCGQAAHEGREHSVSHFVGELAHEATHVDGKFFGTLRALVSKPGFLTAEYWAGRRVSWIPPIRLFAVAAAIHWLASTGVGPLNFQPAMERKRNGDVTVNLTNDPQAAAGKDGGVPVTPAELEDFTEKFRHTHAQIRYFSVLFFALASWGVYAKKQAYFVNHLAGALHFYALWYVLAIGTSRLMTFDPRFAACGLNVAAIYLGLSLRRLYSESWPRTLLKTLVLTVALVVIEMALGFVAAIYVSRAFDHSNATTTTTPSVHVDPTIH